MKQLASAGVLFAVAVAAMRLTAGPQAPDAAPVNAASIRHSPQKKSAEPQAPPGPYRGGCTVFDSDDPKAAPDPNRGEVRSKINRFFALKDSESLTSKTALRFAIALVPDPRHTNLGLIFDRQMVAIQQAAQDEGYNYNSSWLPWNSDSASYPLLDDEQRAGDETGRREACPGIILFRKSIRDLGPDKASNAGTVPSPYDESLVVLVVGEQPTGGLNETQWANAITWLNLNASVEQSVPAAPRSLRILGPSFSGSLVSLQRDLAALRPSPALLEGGSQPVAFFPSASTPIRVLSGSVRRCSTSLWFRRTMQLTRPGAPTAFGSFQASDELQVFRFLNYLKEQGIVLSDVAVVSEDETAYANAFAPPDDKKSGVTAPCDFPYARVNTPVRLSYPRDISALRSAYEKESLFSSGNTRNTHAVLQANAELEGEAANITDTIRTYSGAFTPVEEEAVLYGIVSNLRAHHARYIVLRCSNPLDFLFLTRFFHRAYPEGRIVTVGSDLLFRREIDTTEFRGVLALTNYPLLPREQHWSHLSARPDAAPSASHTHRVPDSHLEGTYLAARYLFDPDAPDPPASAFDQPVVLPFKENLPDFADPFWMHAPDKTFDTYQAPVWLTVVGRDGYWPVAVLNQDSTPNNCLELTDKQASQNCPSPSNNAAPPSSAMVQIQGSIPGNRTVHYDRDPEDSGRFHRSLRFSLPLSWEVCAILASFLLLYQLFGVWLGYRYTSSGLFAPFRIVATPSQAVLVGINTAFAGSLLLQLLMTGLELPNFTNVFKEALELGIFTAFWVISFSLVVWRLYRTGANASRRQTSLLTFIFLAATLLFLISCAAWVWFSDAPIRPANNLPLFFRMTHLTEGVSPLTPILFLLLGFYLWTWQALAGNSLLSCGVPMLPELEGAKCPPAKNPWWRYWRSIWYTKLLGLPVNPPDPHGPARLGKPFHRISYEIGKRIIRIASPVCLDPEIVLLPALLLVAALAYLLNIGTPLLGLEGRAYAWVVNSALLVAFLLTIAEAARLFFTWKELQRLLSALSRLRLRRTFAKIRAVDSNSLWSVSGSVQRVQFHFFAQQLDAAQRLSQFPGGCSSSVAAAAELGRHFSRNSADKVNVGPRWEMPVVAKPEISQPRVYIREVFNHVTAQLLNGLIQHWATETGSLSLETTSAGKAEGETERNVFDMELAKDPVVRTEEEFVCFHYIAFIQNILARMRTMTLSLIYQFLAICLAISFYPFVPRNSIGIWMLINLLFIAATVVYVYAGMERDETLSYITNSRPGRLSTEFYLKTAAFLAGPVIGLLTTLFPAISESFLSWLQPGLDALK